MTILLCLPEHVNHTKDMPFAQYRLGSKIQVFLGDAGEELTALAAYYWAARLIEMMVFPPSGSFAAETEATRASFFAVIITEPLPTSAW